MSLTQSSYLQYVNCLRRLIWNTYYICERFVIEIPAIIESGEVNNLLDTLRKGSYYRVIGNVKWNCHFKKVYYCHSRQLIIITYYTQKNKT